MHLVRNSEQMTHSFSASAYSASEACVRCFPRSFAAVGPGDELLAAPWRSTRAGLKRDGSSQHAAREHAKALTTCSTCSHLHGEVLLCNIALALCNIALAPGQQQAASGRP